jgi:predicted nucleic acid-binding Zn ribbon protein
MTKKRDHQEATEDDEVVAGAVPETDEVLAERCAEYVELNRQIKELGARITLLRKNQKGLEKNLLAIMQTIKLEEIVVDGVKISRIKKLQIVDE